MGVSTALVARELWSPSVVVCVEIFEASRSPDAFGLSSSFTMPGARRECVLSSTGDSFSAFSSCSGRTTLQEHWSLQSAASSCLLSIRNWASSRFPPSDIKDRTIGACLTARMSSRPLPRIASFHGRWTGLPSKSELARRSGTSSASGSSGSETSDSGTSANGGGLQPRTDSSDLTCTTSFDGGEICFFNRIGSGLRPNCLVLMA
mmetsp:Transcript_73985/g.128381  ORF Transcript_73985/g.128381 Transcript_73985/m.128381 type:complete len:205 (+) Transcript_73985:2006-2620(+)